MVETEFPQNKNELQSHKSRRLTEEFNSMIQFQKCMKGVLKLYSGTLKKEAILVNIRSGWLFRHLAVVKSGCCC